jgi:hypothetical protein
MIEIKKASSAWSIEYDKSTNDSNYGAYNLIFIRLLFVNYSAPIRYVQRPYVQNDG